MKTLFHYLAWPVCAFFLAPPGLAQDIGLSALLREDPSLVGTGEVVAQSEAGAPSWEVNPSAVGKAESAFTWWLGTSSSVFPNALGMESPHANLVGQLFYGTTGGIASGVSHIDNFEADYFYQARIVTRTPIDAVIVNQSFIFDESSAPHEVETNYDNYTAVYNTLFISGLGNGGGPYPPASAYNGIGVSAPGGATSIGPTADGRSKPDLSAVAGFTSYSTPLVAGAAAILLQAARRGDGGADTISSATNSMTLKALLLNGAIKPLTWTNSSAAPLDQIYGAGLVHVYNSYGHLRGGRSAAIEKRMEPTAASHLPGTNVNDLMLGPGWDFNTLSSSAGADGINHYYFNVPSNAPNTAVATLVWNRHFGATNLNNLDLFLLRMSDNVVVGLSTSSVDNVEHIFQTSLLPGGYDLQVVKRGGAGPRVSNNETYALAFQWAAETVAIERVADGLKVSWPFSSANLGLESAPTAGPADAWTSVATPPTLSNGRLTVIVIPEGQRFFRLRRW